MFSTPKPFFAALVMAIASVGATAQTATDACGYNAGNQYPVGTSCTLLTFNKPDAFTATYTATGCNGGSNDDAWGWFTATSNYVNLTFDPANSHRPIMHLYTGACGSLSQVACVNSGGNGNNANLSLAVVQGQNYMVRIQRHSDNNAMNGSFCAQRPAFPSNDNPCGATSVSVNGSCSNTAGNNQGASRTTGVADPSCGDYQGGDVWYSFTAPANGAVTIRTMASGLSDSGIALYSATSCSGIFTEIACAADGNGNMGEISQSGLTPGQTYYVRVWGDGNASGAFNICVVSIAVDEPCGATSLGVNNTCSNTAGTNDFATASSSLPDPPCGNYQGGDVWFSFVAPANGAVTVRSMANTLTSSGIAIYSAASCSGGLTLISCSGNGNGNMGQIAQSGLTPGATYYVRVWGKNGATGTFNMCVVSLGNDEACGATSLGVNGSCSNTSSTNLYATPSSSIPNPPCGNYTGGDVWFSFVAPAGGVVTIRTAAGGLTNSAIALYSATSCSAGFSLLACAVDGNGNMGLITQYGLTPGTTYYVRVWGENGASGTFNICVFTPALLHDEPCGAIDLTLGTSCSYSAYTNASSTASSGIPTPGCGNGAYNDVWYRFTAPSNGLATFRVTTGTLVNPQFAVYKANSCSGPFTLIKCDNASGPGNAPFMTLTPLEISPGEVYYLRVWGNNGTTGTYNLCAFTAPATGNCTYVLRMWDSQGDGWGASTVSVQVGAAPAVNYSNTNADEDVAYISVSVGQNVSLSYATGGAGNQGEIRYVLQLVNGPLYMDGPTPGTGLRWAGTADCQSAAPLPSDCMGGPAICGAQNISANPSNVGLTADINHLTRGCLGANERQGYWYRFTISASGLLGFTIAPNNATDDYDFGVWGPYSSFSCPPQETPVRCNYSGTAGNTGLSSLGTNPSEGGGGNKWSSRMPVTLGESYFLYVSNFSQSGLAFALTWQLENGASIDCSLLPVQLLSLNGAPVPQGIQLQWTTATETNTSFFAVERMDESGAFHQIGQLPAAGMSNSTIDYQFLDAQPLPGFNHYRLKMVDLDGSGEISQVVSVANRYGSFVGLFPNPASDQVSVAVEDMPDGQAVVTVLDASGRMARQQRITIAEGQSLITMPLHGIERGHYALSIAFNEGAARHAGRFIVE